MFKKILVGLLLLPVFIFVAGVIVVLVGGGLNSVFKKGSDYPVVEKEAPPEAENKVPQTVKPSEITQVKRPTITYDTAYYDLAGLTKEEIRANKAQARKGSFFEGHDAATTAEININFKRRQRTNRCETVMDQFDLGLTYTYPRLTSLPNISQELASQWNQFIAALKVHEEGHAKIEVERAGLMLKELQNLPTYVTCEEFDRAYNAMASAHEDQTKLIEAQYDKDTQSGRLQGVSF